MTARMGMALKMRSLNQQVLNMYWWPGRRMVPGPMIPVPLLPVPLLLVSLIRGPFLAGNLGRRHHDLSNRARHRQSSPGLNRQYHPRVESRPRSPVHVRCLPVPKERSRVVHVALACPLQF